MSTIDDGGPAFPGIEGSSGYSNSVALPMADGSLVFVNVNHGQSRRDWLAGLAMQALLAREGPPVINFQRMRLEQAAYVIADAMIAEGKK